MDVKDTRDYFLKAVESAKFINERLGYAEIAVVLGSGLNNFTDELVNAKILHYGDIPNVPQPTVKGHSGKLVIGEIGNKKVFCLAGRSHAYEGRHSYELTFFTRVLKLAGCKLMISTNASGGAMEGMYPGCLMIIKDHINFYKRNPLTDTHEYSPLGPQHADLSCIYSTRLANVARSVSEKLNVKLFEGIYGGTAGPTYETPSEVQSFVTFGASCFGMSTMPETMAAKSIGMESFAISLITNLASGLTKEVLTHAEVTSVASESGPAFIRFMKQFLSEVTVLEDDSALLALPPYDENIPATPLPQMQYPSVTHRQMNESVAHVQGLCKEKIDVAIILSEGHSAEEITCSKIVEIPYRDIPHFPAVTASRKGSIIIGAAKSKNIAVLSGNSLDGFCPEEATFLMELLHHLGTKILIQAFIAGTTTEDEKLNQVIVLGDCVDTTTMHPYPRRIQNHKEYQVEKEIFSSRYIQTARANDDIIGTYCHISGPSYPTMAEVNTARLLESKSVGMTSLFCIYAARSLGIEVIGVAENLYYKPLKELKTQTDILKRVNQIIDSFALPTANNPAVFEESGPLMQVSNHLPPPVIQGFYDHVLQSAQYIKNKINSSASVGLVIDTQLKNHVLLDKLQVKCEITFEEVPHMHKQRGSLIFGELDGVDVYVCQGMTMNYIEGESAYESFSYIRLLAVLDAKKIIFVSPVCSVDQILNVGDIAIVKDHVLLSGRTPLFGPNEERWGTRFPDVGEAYNKELQKILFKNAKEAGMELMNVVFGHFVGPIYNSAADARLATTMRLQALSTGLAPEVLVARHMGVSVGAIAVTVASIPPNSEAPFKHHESLSQVITKSVKDAYKM